MILADDAWSIVGQAVNAAGVAGALLLILNLWLRRTLVLAVDADKALAVAKEVHEREIATLRAERDHLRVELSAVWQAHSDEVAARREAERAADRGAGRDELMLGMLAAIRQLVGSPP